MTIEGIDASWRQGSPAWSEVKAAGILWASLKATQWGKSYIHQDWYEAQAPKASAAGLVLGAYHFGVLEYDGITQAKYFLSVATDASWLGLDFESYEEPPGSGKFHKMTDAQARDFAKTVNPDGRPKAIYGLQSDVHRLLDYSEFKGWLSWIAAYTGSKPSPPLDIWQYTSRGQVNGIAGNVDLNHLYGELSKLGGGDSMGAYENDLDKNGVTVPSNTAAAMFALGLRNRFLFDSDPVKYKNLGRDYLNNADYGDGWDSGAAGGGAGHTHGDPVEVAGPAK